MNQKHVLIVEDEAPLAHALYLKLQHEGLAVVLVTNGQEALDLIAKQRFDVILLNLALPVIDGFQVLQSLKESQRMPVVFVLSNLSQQGDEGRVLELGAKKFFIKSNTPLTTIVDEIKKV